MFTQGTKRRLFFVDHIIKQDPLHALLKYGHLPIDHNTVKRVAQERRFYEQLRRYLTEPVKPTTLAQLLALMFKTNSSKQEFLAYYVAYTTNPQHTKH